MDNLTLWNKYRTVPPTAQKKITGGRLNNFTDINPMWRFKSLTEQFGQCGVGWYPEIVDQWVTPTMASDEVAAHVKIKLWYKQDGEWAFVPALGGSMLLSQESKGLYTNDECFKMAFTDAVGVACKMLGFGADTYWEKDSTKYNDPKKDNVVAKDPNAKISSAALKGLIEYLDKNHVDSKKVCAKYGITQLEDMTEEMLTKYREEVKK